MDNRQKEPNKKAFHIKEEHVRSPEPDQQNIFRLEKDLRKYKDLFDNAPIGIIQATLDGRVIEANPAIVSMLGYDSTIDYKSSIKNIAEDLYVEPDKRSNLIDLSLKKDQLLDYTSRFRRKDGSVIYCKLNVRTARNKDGGVDYLESFIEDVTEQHKIAEALKESESLYRGIFENTGAGTIIIEDDKTISFANTGFEKLTGYTKQEVEGKMKWPVIVANPDELATMLYYHGQRRAGRRGVPIEYEFEVIDKHGQRKNVFLRVDMIGGTNRSVASLIDITSLKKAQRSFRESESKLRGVLEAFEGIVYICDKNYHLLYMNKMPKGLKMHNLTGRLCYRELYGFQQPCDWCAHNRIFKGETVKFEFLNPNTGRWSYAVNTPIFTDDHSVTKKQTVIIDIHERKIAEDTIREQGQYLKKENIRLRSTIQDRYKFGSIVGKSAVMQKVYELILRAAATDANVIIYGESGTGKELVAKAIHDMSDRGNQQFVPVNCGAIPQHLLESEFFGYKKGAFTGAYTDKRGYLDQAKKGTLFLDELGEIKSDMQVKLLRVLGGSGFSPVGSVEIITPDIRIIAATNRNVSNLLESGKMREDFFYRIHIIPIRLPPLRDRKEDIPLLVEHFLKKYQTGNAVAKINGKVMDDLIGYNWPGNIRELENSLQRLVSLGHLDLFCQPNKPDIGQIVDSNNTLEDFSMRVAVHNFEKNYIGQMLKKYQWNRTVVARKLKIERKTLYLKMKKLGIKTDHIK